MASLVCIAFFYFGIFRERVSRWSLSDAWFLVIWLALFVIGAVALRRTTRPLVNLTIILIVGASVLIFFPIARIATYQANHPAIATTDSRLWPTPLENPAPPSGARLPDIYVIIPDDYARTDVLRQYFHYDNRAFIGELEKRGFVVADQARSPYSDSELNVAAALNMDYMSGLPRDPREGFGGCPSTPEAERGQSRIASAGVARVSVRPSRHRRGHLRRRQPQHLPRGLA
jgi:hypothetical protein